ncbi:S41 family peptidase [Neptunitalea lumnitzerae]|uniref:Tail specific protease domain-containing protein n=1 Tax=Neptunitalea lumnitzerae TaxID=2965509 RepID=A0ABQ5MJB3_9FLAO|nr:S41 family peptidase [Neptunitalea sp. Y10]GLB49145.1 hypothetical protein Y10_15130 [Neptunitalea sp. Y10]
MKTYYLALMLCLILVRGYSQKLEMEKASPFTAVKWEKNTPIVLFENHWYTLEKLDTYTTEELLAFCRKEYGSKWKKRFSEDLVEILTELGTPPEKKVLLILSDSTKTIKVTGTYNFENRQKVLKYNNQHPSKQKAITHITAVQALEDINEFEEILTTKSSYIHLSTFDYTSAINNLKHKISSKKEKIDVNFLTHELAKIMASIGDRHASVKNEFLDKKKIPTYSLQLPYTLAPLHDSIIVLKKTNSEYEYLSNNFPYLKSINNIPVHNLIDSMSYKAKLAPKEAKFRRGVTELQNLGELYFKNNIALPKKIKVVFTNGKTDSLAIVELNNKQYNYTSKQQLAMYDLSKEIENSNFTNMSKIIDNQIGYLTIPKMYHSSDNKELEKFIDDTFINFKNTKALIIDIRFNPGGGRELINNIGNYIIPKTESPWVANIAYLRTDEEKDFYKSMSYRYLNMYGSETITELDRNAIDTFLSKYRFQRNFDITKFSKPHYMILKSGNTNYTKPVYILVNERSFSAATVFTSAFKELPNVTIVGVTTDGSSGNSKKIYLKNSNIRVKVSTMLSFQRNGLTLDGNGTQPDIYIPEDEAQVLHGNDTQLNKLVEYIHAH